jgi:hypothetical protein
MTNPLVNSIDRSVEAFRLLRSIRPLLETSLFESPGSDLQFLLETYRAKIDQLLEIGKRGSDGEIT